MSKFKKIAISVLCVFVLACVMTVGILFGTAKTKPQAIADGANSTQSGHNASAAAAGLGSNNETAYVVSLSGTATDMAKQWKTAMGYNGSVTVILKDNWTANGSFGTCGDGEVGFGSTGGLVIPAGKTVVLNMNGHNLNRGLGSATADGAVIVVETGANLIINGSGNITGGYNNDHGGGIYSYGDLTINGATVKGNTAGTYGGGIVVDNATFNFISGEISGNNAAQGAAGLLLTTGAKCIMTGGTINGNTTNVGCAGLELYDNCTMTMSGGTISGNTAAKSAGGVGLYINSTFKMTGGAISGNSATGGVGGGILVNNGCTFDMSGGTISGNTASGDGNGGGVHILDGTFNLSGGTITNNICPGVGAIGISSGKFNMSGGSIVNNTACSWGVIGNTGTINLTGGVISGNPNGFCYSPNLNLSIGGAVSITGNTTANLQVASGKKINVTGALIDTKTDAIIGVTVAANQVFTTNYLANFGGTIDTAISRVFYSDNSSLVAVRCQANGTVSAYGGELKMQAGTQDKIDWTLTVNGTSQPVSNGVITCYYGDVISAATATCKSKTVTWSASAQGFNGSTSTDDIVVYGKDPTVTSLKNVGIYSFFTTYKADSTYEDTSAFRSICLQIKPRPITVTIDNKTSKFGDSLETLTGSITSGTLASGDTLSDLGITYTKAAGDSAGKYVITGSAANEKYDVTFINGTYDITSTAVSVIINDQTAVYGSKYYALTKTENNTPVKAVGEVTEVDGKKVDSEGYAVDDDGDRIDENGNKIYNGGWRYATDTPAKFEQSDLTSSTRYPMSITCSGAGFSDISSTQNTAYIAVGNYIIAYVASPNYDITFTSNNTEGASDTQGVFVITPAAITVKSATEHDSTNRYDSVDYDGNAKTIAIPTGAITLKGDVTTSVIKYVVFDPDAEDVPENTPKADDSAFWAGASSSVSKTEAGSYKVYSLITATNHSPKVYVWTFKIGASAATFSLTAKHGDDEVEKNEQGAYKVDYDGVAVVVSIKFDDTAVTTTNCPVLIFYKGTGTYGSPAKTNTYGTAADTDFPDESEDKDGNALGLGNSAAPKEAGTYQATVIADPTKTSSYELDGDCDKTFTFTIEPKKMALPTVKFKTGSTGTYNGNEQTIQYTYDTAAVKITAYTGVSDTVGGVTKTYKDLTQGSSTNNTALKTTTAEFTATNAGDYAVKFDLTSTRNYKWDITDTTKQSAAQIVTCTVKKAQLDFTLVSPVKKDGSEVWTWGAGTTAESGITAKAGSLTGNIGSDVITFNVSWYKKPESGNPTLHTEQSGVDYESIELDISSFDEQGTYYVVIQVADGATDNANDNYCLKENDTNFTPQLEGVKLRSITVGAGSVDVSKIVWKWLLEDSGADPAVYVKGADNADDDTKLVYKGKSVDGVWKALNYTLSADLSALDYLELNTSKGVNGYENVKYSAAGTYTAKVYVKIKADSSYEFVIGDSTKGYTADTKTTAYVEFEWVINKQTISFTDEEGNSLVKWAYYLSKNNEPPAADATWTDFSDKNSPTRTGKLVYVKIADKYFTDLGISISDVSVIYSNQSQANVSATPLTTKGTVTLKGDAAKNYTLETKTASLEWKLGNTPITVNGWGNGDEDGRTVDNGKGITFTLPKVNIAAEDEETAEKLAENIEYKYSYTFEDADGNVITREDVDEKTMMDDLFVMLDESGQQLDITVKAVLTDEGGKSYDIKFDGADETIDTQIGDSKMKVFVKLENESSVYGDISFNLKAEYYFGNVLTSDPQEFPAEDLEITVNGTDSFALSAISNYALYIKDAGEYKLTFKITANADVYKLANTTLTFTVLPKEIAIPQITGEIVFAGKNIDLKEYLDANYAEYSDREIVQWTAYDTDCYNVGSYKATLTIVNENYVWADPAAAAKATKSLVRYSAADNVAVVTDKVNANYTWEIKPFVLSGDKLWNTSGKEGASLNLPEWVAALMSGENPTLGVEYSYRTDKASPAVDPEWKGGNSYFVSATLNGADAKNFVFENGTTASDGSPVSEMVTYKVPQSGAAAFFSNVGNFVKNNWLWFVIGAAILLFLILLIIIIAVARKKKKKKEEEAAKAEKEEAKAAAAATAAAPMLAASAAMVDEKAKLEAEKAKMEAELAKAKMEAEAEAAKAKMQAELDLQKAKMEAEMAKMRAEAEAQAKQAQQPVVQQVQPVQQPVVQQVQPVQQPAQQPQYNNVDANLLAELRAELAALRLSHAAPAAAPAPAPAPAYPTAPYAGGSDALAKIEAEITALRSEQRVLREAELKASQEVAVEKMKTEFARLRADSYYGGYSQPVSAPAPTPAPVHAPAPEARNALPPADMPSIPANVVGALILSAMNMAKQQPAKPTELPAQVIEAESQSGAVNTPTMYPPDAVITTTTTVDTTNRAKTVNGGDRGDDIFDIDGFYDKFEENK